MKFPIEQVHKCHVLQNSLELAKGVADWEDWAIEILQGFYDEAVAEFEKQHADYLEWEATKEDFEF